jgi:hypothetical protein
MKKSSQWKTSFGEDGDMGASGCMFPQPWDRIDYMIPFSFNKSNVMIQFESFDKHNRLL